MTEPLLYQLDHVRFEVARRTILEDVSLSLEAGRIYGLVGPNGSGKSTLIKLLARQQKASVGSVRVFGKDIAEFSDRSFAQTVAYMPQFTPPAEGLTARELIALGRFPWHGTLGRVSEQDRQAIDTAIAQTGLQPLADRLVDSLSGGERQRVWLAMLIAQTPQCLLLDEPTSALDIAHQVEVLAIVRTLVRTQRISAILVLHDINLAARYCDEILALRDGAVIARGTPDDIMSEETLAAIYGIGLGILRHPQSGEPIGYVR